MQERVRMNKANLPAVKYDIEGATPESINFLLLHSYVPKKMTVPENEPRKAGETPPYNPRFMPSCRQIV